jgi:hypothetical protein
MIRLAPLVAALLVFSACDKDKKEPPTESVKDKTPAKPAVKVEEPEQVTQTGVLDLELASRASSYTVRNATFELTFPVRPNVQAQHDKGADGTPLTSGLALAQLGRNELGFFVMPIPPGVTYDVKKGLDGARDGAVKNIHATVLSEVPTKLSTLDGRKVTATAMGGTVYVDLYLAWDDGHRQVFGVFTSSPTAQAGAAATAFVSSFKLRTAPKAAVADPAKPADSGGPAKVTPTGVLGLEIAEQGGLFTLRDSAYRVTFPSKPAIEKSDSVAPDGTKLPGAVATATIGADQGYGMILLRIPKGVRYDAKKGLKAARDGMIRQLGAKLLTDTATTIGGIPGRRSVASVTIENKPLTLELQFAYDKKRSSVFGLYSATPAGAPSPAALAFFSSFGIGKS